MSIKKLTRSHLNFFKQVSHRKEVEEYYMQAVKLIIQGEQDNNYEIFNQGIQYLKKSFISDDYGQSKRAFNKFLELLNDYGLQGFCEGLEFKPEHIKQIANETFTIHEWQFNRGRQNLSSLLKSYHF